MDIFSKSYQPNLLLVSGTGRNVGKTTFVTGLTRKMSAFAPVTCIKISPHFHSVNYAKPSVYEKGEFAIYIETNSFGSKDSNLMRFAGAENVYYIQTKESSLKLAFERVMEFCSEDEIIICESGGLYTFIEPGLFFSISDECRIAKMNNAGSISLVRDNIFFKEIIESIDFINGQWEYKLVNERV